MYYACPLRSGVQPASPERAEGRGWLRDLRCAGTEDRSSLHPRFLRGREMKHKLAEPKGGSTEIQALPYVDTLGLVFPTIEAAAKGRASFRRLSGFPTRLGFHRVHDCRKMDPLAVPAAAFRPGEPVAFRAPVGRMEPDMLPIYAEELYPFDATVYRADFAADLDPEGGLEINLSVLGFRRRRPDHAAEYLGHLDRGDDLSLVGYSDLPSKRTELLHASQVQHIEARKMGRELKTLDPYKTSLLDPLNELLEAFTTASLKPALTASSKRLRDLHNVIRRHGSEPVSDRDLAAAQACSERTISRRISALSDLGLLRVVQRTRGRGRASIYCACDPPPLWGRVPYYHEVERLEARSDRKRHDSCPTTRSGTRS